MSGAKTQSFATRAIHAGASSLDSSGALTPPVYMTSTFAFDSVEQGAARFAGEQEGHFYSRISNPTQELLEARLAALEEGQAALATASGMGAITSTLWSLLAPGDQIIADKTLYGCSFGYIQHGLRKFGVEVDFVDCTDLEALERALSAKTRVVYFETPVNPTMRLMDISALSRRVHDYNPAIKVVVDNTYCTPVLQQPLTLGADLVVHSATKYLGGHGDLIAGAVVGDEETLQQIRLFGLKDMTGAVIAPLTAFLVLRGLKTLELRMERHSASAMQLAEQLSEHQQIERVYYPGLPSSPFFALAQQQMRLPGGMIAFELKGGLAAGGVFMNRLKMIKRAVSLGDAETLCQHPASMTHSTYTPEERAQHGISEGLIRLSVGLEAAEDIYRDLEQALAGG
ncbi:methionine gamma-lyase [Aestuariirhabdus sp. Z084]|uniref:methionine gamma-lyase n=1 Tax=Aestuariirhabdus haliotis TaxID=2918751 RepID=UPI00201B391F|nr:methionine gamma-lyase [Aestuariirhabdus haliotis]MCL6417066.1 methionine gamma-lyase [Aestuariirhabdus haliotis]MCL6420977.1 methionine gamma-lyase [Aestuariirhabdus haliotis]